MNQTKITVINTGGTFNKVYDAVKGSLDVVKENVFIEEIIRHFYGNIDFELISIINKDSLQFTDEDRDTLARSVIEATYDNVLIVHGTDTMQKSARYLHDKTGTTLHKKVIFVGSMFPYAIQKDEAIANFSLAVGFLNAPVPNDIYIAMHGLVDCFENIQKDRTLGKFIKNPQVG
jgi:L-asparaginase